MELTKEGKEKVTRELNKLKKCIFQIIKTTEIEDKYEGIQINIKTILRINKENETPFKKYLKRIKEN